MESQIYDFSQVSIYSLFMLSSYKFNVWFGHGGCTDYNVEIQTESED